MRPDQPGRGHYRNAHHEDRHHERELFKSNPQLALPSGGLPRNRECPTSRAMRELGWIEGRIAPLTMSVAPSQSEIREPWRPGGTWLPDREGASQPQHPTRRERYRLLRGATPELAPQGRRSHRSARRLLQALSSYRRAGPGSKPRRAFQEGPQNTGDKLRAFNMLNARLLHPLVRQPRPPAPRVAQP
jgi:hypothetical protein